MWVRTFRMLARRECRHLVLQDANFPFFAHPGSCEPSLDVSDSCTVMETDLLFFLNGDVDPDEASYAGYRSIEFSMANNDYVGTVPTIVKMEYLSPLPLPVPPHLTGGGATTKPPIVLSSTEDSTISVSPWTIGACVATMVGGIISIVVWARSRQTRHRRHVQLLDDNSWVDVATRNPVSV